MYRRPFGPFTSTALLFAILIAAWAYSPEGTPAASNAEAACEAAFDPATIEAGSVHEEVAVTLSESIGDVHEASTPENSGLTVLWLHGDEEPEPPARVRVSALNAQRGEWEVTLQGTAGDCVGVFTVFAGG